MRGLIERRLGGLNGFAQVIFKMVDINHIKNHTQLLRNLAGLFSSG
jgi:hypothetical protein